jgi:proline iminopeptidase
MTSESHGSKKGSISRGGYELRYTIEGSGLPAIVIGSSVYYSRSFSQNLRKSLRIAFVDWRGFAEPSSSAEPNDISLDILLDDIEAIRKQIGFNRSIIIGHSAHALLALEYAKKFPEHTTHVAGRAQS